MYIEDISSGNVKSFKKLIKDIDPHIILKNFMMHFVENENIKCLKFFIKKYPEMINNQDEYGRTLLHYAVQHSYEATSFLLDCNASTDIKDLNGYTPLLEFFENYYFEEYYNILELLIERVASNNVNDVDENGNGPLHHLADNIKPENNTDLCSNDSENILDIYENMFNLLVKHGAKPFLKNNEGDTPLMYCVKSEGYEGCEYKTSKIFEEWIIKMY